jgi:hypothetical protein
MGGDSSKSNTCVALMKDFALRLCVYAFMRGLIFRNRLSFGPSLCGGALMKDFALMQDFGVWACWTLSAACSAYCREGLAMHSLLALAKYLLIEQPFHNRTMSHICTELLFFKVYYKQ